MSNMTATPKAAKRIRKTSAPGGALCALHEAPTPSVSVRHLRASIAIETLKSPFDTLAVALRSGSRGEDLFCAGAVIV